MKIKIFLTCLAVVATFSCTYHMYTKEEAIKEAKKRNAKAQNIIIEDGNNTVKILTRDSNYEKMDEIYQFNDRGEQIKYTVIASCDSCFRKYVSQIIKSGNYDWKKLNDSTYISKYRLSRILSIHNSIYSYDITENNVNRKEFELLRKNAR